MWVYLTLNGLTPVAIATSICTTLLAYVISQRIQVQKSTAKCKPADDVKADNSVLTILHFNCCSKCRAWKGITEYQRKYTAPIFESSVDEKTTTCRLRNVSNYCHANARQCTYNRQAGAMHLRQVSAFTYDGNKQGCVGEPTHAPELVQCKQFEKWLFM